MKDADKTKEQLIKELAELRQQVIELQSDALQNKELKESLLKEKTFSDATLDSLPGIFYMFTEQGNFLRWNNNLETVTGYSWEEIEKMHPLDFFDDEDKRNIAERIKEVFEKGEAITEANFVLKSGEKIPYLFTGRRILHDKTLSMLGMGIDITMRKQAEEERLKLENNLRHLQKMEAIATLTDGIAHDFNNVLSAILGHVELTFLTLTEQPDLDQIRTSLKEILHAVMRAQELVRQLLTFGGQIEEEIKPLEIHLIVSGTLNRLRALLPSSIKIRSHIYPENAIVMANPSQIHQVVMNLCTNAYHSMREQGGVLEVTLEAVDVDAEFEKTYPSLHKGPYVRLTVTDNGHGMLPWVMERIFEPYFTTKVHGKGSGLGLTMTYNIVTSMGGAIIVNSEQGEGTTFQVYLPRLDRVLLPGFIKIEPTPRDKGKILFVDDEKPIAQLGESLLEHFGYQVTSLTSSREALEVLRSQPDEFDLVITDLTMPQLNGIELAVELKKLRPAVKIIICTGFSEVIAIEKTKEIGIQEILIKPITADNLVKTVRKVMGANSN